MASAAPPTSLLSKVRNVMGRFFGATWTLTKRGSVWFIPMILTSASAAYLSYFYNQKANSELALQQQALSDLQSFRNSGAALDQAVSALSDALVDEKGITEARSRLRGALTAHLSDAIANEGLLGSASASYIYGLSELRTTVDDVQPASIRMQAKLWQDSLKLMSARRKMVAVATTEIGKR